MPLVIPTSSQNDIISSLKSSGLTNAANASFFGNGSLSGTVDATNLQYKPIQAVQLNPNDYPNLSPSQLSAIQRQSEVQTDQYNQQQNKVLNQFNQLRQNRLQQNEDSLATTQQLFSVMGGVNPLQSGRNAAALTGLQAGARQDLVNLFNQAQDQNNQIQIGANTANLQALQSAVNTDLQLGQTNFNQGLQLTDRLGTFVDANGNLKPVAGQQNVSTLASNQFQLSKNQTENSIDLSQRQQTMNESNALNQITGGSTNYAPNGQILYTSKDGNPTTDAALAQTDATGQPTKYQNINQTLQDLKSVSLFSQLQNALKSNDLTSFNNLLGGYGAKSGTGTGTGGKTTDPNTGVTYKDGKIAGFSSDSADLKRTGVSGNLMRQAIADGNSSTKIQPQDWVQGKLANLKEDASRTEFNRFFFENNADPNKVSNILYSIRSQDGTGQQQGFKYYDIKDPKDVTVQNPKDGKTTTLYDYVKNSGDNILTDQDIATVLSTAAKTNNGKIKELTNPKEIANFLDTNTPSSNGNRFNQYSVLGMMYQQNAKGATVLNFNNENDRTAFKDSVQSSIDGIKGIAEAYASGDINPNDPKKTYDTWIKADSANRDKVKDLNLQTQSDDKNVQAIKSQVNDLYKYYTTTLDNFGGNTTKADDFFKLTTGYALGTDQGKYNSELADKLLSTVQAMKKGNELPKNAPADKKDNGNWFNSIFQSVSDFTRDNPFAKIS